MRNVLISANSHTPLLSCSLGKKCMQFAGMVRRHGHGVLSTERKPYVEHVKKAKRELKKICIVVIRKDRDVRSLNERHIAR